MGQAGDRSDDTIDDDILQLSSRANPWVVPTIIGFSATVRVMDEPGLLDRPDTAPFLTPFLRWWAQRLPASSRTPYARFAATARESARKLIAAAPSVAAGIIGAEQEIGTIEPGKLADPIVLNADPLENIGNTRSIWRVIKGGEIYDPEVVRDAADHTGVRSHRVPGASVRFRAAPSELRDNRLSRDAACQPARKRPLCDVMARSTTGV